MSQENVDLARKIIESFNRRGWDGLWRFADPEIEFHEPPEQPGSTVFKGLDAVREGVESSWSENWIEQRSVLERVEDLGDRVLLLTVEHLVGRDGIEVTQPGGHILTFRGGKIIRYQGFWTQQEALRAAGLGESE
jgi:ketosteroid isomerase-like protein